MNPILRHSDLLRNKRDAINFFKKLYRRNKKYFLEKYRSVYYTGDINFIKIKKSSMPKEKKNINIVSETKAVYEKKSIQHFSSFEERDKDRLKYHASLSPEELLKNLKLMVLASFCIKDEAELKDMPRIINLHPRQ